MTYDGTDLKLYWNGGEDATPTTFSASIDVNDEPLTMGKAGFDSQYLDGKLDEARVSSVARPAEWISTEFNNQDSPGVGGFLASIDSQESASGGGATWAADEDDPLTGLDKLTTKRVRIEISNEGTASSGSVLYRLEVSQANPTTCDAGGNTWNRVNSSADWNMALSTHFADADPTSDIDPGLTNENTTFVDGELKESTDEVNTGITLSTTEFTEIEYAVQATASAIDAATYCFRLTDAGTATDFTYTETKYAKVTLSGGKRSDYLHQPGLTDGEQPQYRHGDGDADRWDLQWIAGDGRLLAQRGTRGHDNLGGGSRQRHPGHLDAGLRPNRL